MTLGELLAEGVTRGIREFRIRASVEHDVVRFLIHSVDARHTLDFVVGGNSLIPVNQMVVTEPVKPAETPPTASTRNVPCPHPEPKRESLNGFGTRTHDRWRCSACGHIEG